MPALPLVTIFTPTYNRAHTLHRVFYSLNAQTVRSFEWLVIDDGSIDGTAQLVAGWIQSADFPIRYLHQRHAGKHFAHNRALIEARGRFFSCLDSDDALVPDALEKFANAWNSIPESERRAFYSVGGLCCDQSGRIVGDTCPTNPFDADLRELTYVHRVRGEKLIFGLTDVLRNYPFPEIPCTYMPESVVWLDVAKVFKTRWLNEVVRIYYVDDPETGATVSKRVSLGDHAVGRWHYYIWLLNNDLEYFFQSPMPFLKAAVMLPVVVWFSNRTFMQSLQALSSRWAKLLVLSLIPASILLCLFDSLKNRGRRGEK